MKRHHIFYYFLSLPDRCWSLKLFLFISIFYELFKFCNPIADISIGCQWIVKCRLILFHGCKFFSSAVSTYDCEYLWLLINSWNVRMMKFLSFSTRRCVFILSIASNDKIYFLMPSNKINAVNGGEKIMKFDLLWILLFLHLVFNSASIFVHHHQYYQFCYCKDGQFMSRQIFLWFQFYFASYFHHYYWIVHIEYPRVNSTTF